MNKENIRIAKELIRIAKILVQDEKTAKWNWRHPFSFTQKSQEINELEDKIKNGEINDTVLVKLTDYKNKGESKSDRFVESVDIKGEIIKPEESSITKQDFLFGEIFGNKIIIHSYEPWSGDKYSWFREYPHSSKTSEGLNLIWGLAY